MEKTDFYCQKRGEKTHFTSKISVCIPTIKRSRIVIQARKTVTKVAFIILTTHFVVTEMYNWFQHQPFVNLLEVGIFEVELLQTCGITLSNRYNWKKIAKIRFNLD